MMFKYNWETGKTSKFHEQGHIATFDAVKWFPWAETMLCGLERQQIRLSLSPQIVVNLSIIFMESKSIAGVSIPVRTKHCSF